MSANTARQLDIVKQTHRVVELLDIALSVLKEKPTRNDNQLAEIVKKIEHVKSQLSNIPNLPEPLSSSTIYPNNKFVDNTMRLVKRVLNIPRRIVQSTPPKYPVPHALSSIRDTGEYSQPRSVDGGQRTYSVYSKNSTAGPDTYDRRKSKTNSRSEGLVQSIPHSIEAKPHLNAKTLQPLPISSKINQVKKEKGEYEGKERRQYTRVPLKTEIDFIGHTNFYTGFVEDISSGGLYVSTYNLQPIGTRIELSFTLPNEYLINVSGQVRWIRDPIDPEDDIPPGMGIMFEDLKREDKNQIDTFIEARSPLFHVEDT